MRIETGLHGGEVGVEIVMIPDIQEMTETEIETEIEKEGGVRGGDVVDQGVIQMKNGDVGGGDREKDMVEEGEVEVEVVLRGIEEGRKRVEMKVK